MSGRFYCSKCNTGLIHEVCPVCGRKTRKIPTPFVHYDSGSAGRPRKRRSPSQAARLIPLLAKRDGWVCHLCKEPIDRALKDGPRRATLDHLLPRSRGGTNAKGNLKLAHAECNETRGNRPLPELVV